MACKLVATMPIPTIMVTLQFTSALTLTVLISLLVTWTTWLSRMVSLTLTLDSYLPLRLITLTSMSSLVLMVSNHLLSTIRKHMLPIQVSVSPLLLLRKSTTIKTSQLLKTLILVDLLTETVLILSTSMPHGLLKKQSVEWRQHSLILRSLATTWPTALTVAQTTVSEIQKTISLALWSRTWETVVTIIHFTLLVLTLRHQVNWSTLVVRFYRHCMHGIRHLWFVSM